MVQLSPEMRNFFDAMLIKSDDVARQIPQESQVLY